MKLKQPKQPKKPKKVKHAYRITIQINEPDGEDYTTEEDMLVSEMTPDTMTDFFAYFDWYADDGYEVLSAEPIEITEWKEMRVGHRWRKFFELYGFGEHLSIDYWCR